MGDKVLLYHKDNNALSFHLEKRIKMTIKYSRAVVIVGFFKNQQLACFVVIKFFYKLY
jgi:hypothetical protein